MNYSYNLDRKEIIFAHAKDINASFKDLCVVCDAVRYRNVATAISILDGVINENKAMEFRRHNRYMGSRHELGGKKGRYPRKCAAIVRKVIINAYANAKNKGEDPESMFVVHASANKTNMVPRSPPKGTRSVRSGGYGYSKLRRSNLVFAKVEIGIANKEHKELGARMKRVIKAIGKTEKPVQKKELQKKKPAPKPQVSMKPLEAPILAKEASKEQQIKSTEATNQKV